MIDKTYYQEMLSKERLIPFFDKDRLVCFLTFWIGNDEDKYVQDNPWEVIEDEADTGKTCFIAQLLTDKDKINPKLSYEIWHRFKKYIKENFKQVEYIRWNHWKNNQVNVFIKKI